MTSVRIKDQLGPRSFASRLLRGHHVAEGANISFDFLYGDDIEAGDNLASLLPAAVGNVFDGREITAGGIVLSGGPDAGEITEGADVPGGY